MTFYSEYTLALTFENLFFVAGLGTFCWLPLRAVLMLVRLWREAS